MKLGREGERVRERERERERGGGGEGMGLTVPSTLYLVSFSLASLR